MNTIPTAEEFCRKHQNSNHLDMISQLMVEFAKLHLQAQQEVILENVKMIQECGKMNKNKCDAMFCRNCSEIIDKDSIINAYNINLVK